MPSSMLRAGLLLSLALGLPMLAGCGSEIGPSSDLDASSPGSDSGSSSDAGTDLPDAVGPGADAGPASDAGPSDGGPVSMPCMATGSCDPFDPTSCGAQACRPSMTGTRCVDTAATTVGEGESCTTGEECAAGTLCLSFSTTGTDFRCHRMCPRGSIGLCGFGSVCTGTIGDTCVQVCRPLPPVCDIYAQDCTTAGQTCTFTSNPETGDPYTGCRAAGDRTEGQTCGGAVGTCGFDLVCIRTDTVTACRQPCDPADPTDTCPAGQACTGMARTWMVGFCVPTAP